MQCSPNGVRAVLSVITLTAVFAPAPGAIAQTWIKQAPFPADDHPRSIFFVTPSEGWIVGADEIVLRTTDGGAHWKQHPAFPRNPLIDETSLSEIQFVDAAHGFIGGHHVHRTVDGGATWQDLGFHGQVGRMEFVTPTLGFISTNGGVRRTTDGGTTFQTVWNPPASDIAFLDQQVGLISSGGDLYKTVNGGTSWSFFSPQEMTRLLFVDEDIVIGLGFNGIYRSQDGGVSWQAVASSGLSFAEVERIGGASLAAIDEGFGVFVSHDLGATWTQTQQTVGSWSPLSGVKVDIHFDGSGGGQAGYAAGSGGVVLKTTDGGQTWAQINSGAPMPLLDIDIRRDGQGVAVGYELTVVRTSDFGRHWVAQSAQEPVIYPHMITAQIIDADTMVAAGDDGLFYRSDDGGVKWTLLNDGIFEADAQIRDLHFLDQQQGWLFAWLIDGGDPGIYHTTNGGGSWTRIGPTTGSPLLGGQMISPTTGWALTTGNGLLRTTDNWATWSAVVLPGSSESFEHFAFVDAQVGWFSGFFGTVLKTTDGGQSFQLQVLPGFIGGGGAGSDRGTDVVAISKQEAYIATFRTVTIERGIIYHTTDGGETWSALEHFFDSGNQFAGRAIAIDALREGRIWAVSASGFIWAANRNQLDPAGQGHGAELGEGK